MKFTVQAWFKRRGGTYDGKGSGTRWYEFDDRPSAERFAQELVELKGAHYAKVEEAK